MYSSSSYIATEWDMKLTINDQNHLVFHLHQDAAFVPKFISASTE
jgi:hypothetical protein